MAELLVAARYKQLRRGCTYLAAIPADLVDIVTRCERTRNSVRCKNLHQLCIVPPGYEDLREPGQLHVRNSALFSGKIVYCRGARNMAFFKLEHGVAAIDISYMTSVGVGDYYICGQTPTGICVMYILGQNAQQVVYSINIPVQDRVFVIERESYILEMIKLPVMPLQLPSIYVDLRSEQHVSV